MKKSITSKIILLGSLECGATFIDLTSHSWDYHPCNCILQVLKADHYALTQNLIRTIAETRCEGCIECSRTGYYLRPNRLVYPVDQQ